MLDKVDRGYLNGLGYLRGPYGDALYALGKREFVDGAWLDSLDSLVRNHLVNDLLQTKVIDSSMLDGVARLERWVATLREGEARDLSAEHWNILSRFIRWQLIHHDRSTPATIDVMKPRFWYRRALIRRIIEFLTLLQKRSRSLATCKRPDLERFELTQAILTFVRWARKARLTRCVIPTVPSKLKLIALGSVERDAQIKRLREDASLPLDVRIAGLLVHKGFKIAQIAALRLDDISDGTPMIVRVGKGRYPLIGGLAALLRDFRDSPTRSRRHHIERNTSPWLFPGIFPSAPVSRHTLTRKLKQYGIHVTPARNAFLHLMAQRLVWLKVALGGLGLSSAGMYYWREVSNGKYALYYAHLRRQ